MFLCISAFRLSGGLSSKFSPVFSPAAVVVVGGDPALVVVSLDGPVVVVVVALCHVLVGIMEDASIQSVATFARCVSFLPDSSKHFCAHY